MIETYSGMYSTEGIEVKPMINHSFYPVNKLLSDDQRAEWINWVDFKFVEAPSYLQVGDQDPSEMVKWDTFDKRYVFSKCLSAMRSRMVEEGESHAWIILGGKWVDFKGRMPGVLEEFLCIQEKRLPIYLIGGFGGVAKGIIRVLQGEVPQQFKLDFYQDQYPVFHRFLEEYNGHSWTKDTERTHFPDIVQTLLKIGRSNPDFGLNNGLSREENLRLFETQHELEIISLILKGLQVISHKNGSSRPS